MPESKKRKKKRKPVSSSAKTELNPTWNAGMSATPRWWAPVFITLGMVGLVWLVITYMCSAAYPIPHIGQWNIAIALGLMFSGFMMVLRWR